MPSACSIVRRKDDPCVAYDGTEMSQASARIPHQLNVWFQCHRESDHGVLSYSYPYSGVHEIREQRLELKLSGLEQSILTGLDALIDSVVARIPPPTPVRLPHAGVRPRISFGYFTLAVQDKKRAVELPACRLYYYEEIVEIPSKVEREIRLRRHELDSKQLDLAERVGASLNKMAWQDYERRLGKYFRAK